MQAYPLWVWAAFLAFIAAMLALDLGVFHRQSHTVRLREALTWCAVWVSLALGFAVLVFFWHGRQSALEFVTGYVVELSLSVDNVFVFILLFAYFRVPADLHHRVLFWGILGAVVMRAVFIFAGIAILERFHWVVYVFGALLVFTGIKMARSGSHEVHPEHNIVVRLARRFLRLTDAYEGPRFLTRKDGRWFATPLFLVLVAVETTDLVFAVDSIPAILAITQDAFIVFTSNIFAILGLRSFYFALSGVMQLFRFLSAGLAIVLIFVGAKMLLSGYVHIPIEISLAVIGTVLAVAVLLSLVIKAPPARLPGQS